MSDDALKAMKEFEIDLDEIAKGVTDEEVRKKALEAYAAPIVDEAKRLAGPGGGVFPGATGELAKSITTQMDGTKLIKVGWTWAGYYGVMWERGYIHAKAKIFVKRPHLRPAFESKKDEGRRAALEILRKAIGGKNNDTNFKP